jgi:hypothetical protein
MCIGWLVNENHFVVGQFLDRPYQPPNAHVRISGIVLRNAMAAAAVKKI